MSNKHKRGVHAPKSYRISMFYEILFDACTVVLGKDKTSLTYALVQNDPKEIDINLMKRLPLYNKNQLMELMIDEVRKNNRDIKATIPFFSHERIEGIKQCIEKIYILQKKPRGIMLFRILPEYSDFMTTFKGNQSYAEALESIIANYVVHQEPMIYELICITYYYLASQRLTKK